MDVGGWNVLAFHFLDGYRHVDLAPGSPDLDRIANTLRALALTNVPDGLDVRRADQRYASYAGGDGTPFMGTVLCHTDLHKHNILVAEADPLAKLVDWAWPTAGADWIDTACVILQLISEGHTSRQAEAWGEQIESYRRARADHVSLFVKAVKNLWEEIAEADPLEWKTAMALAANEWAAHRSIA
jgi:thiamine kinase-like enzyme